MADYTLEAGKGTAVREDAGALEGYVDIDVDELDAQANPADANHIVIQDGTNDPEKITLAQARGGYDTLWVGAGAMVPATTDGAEANTIETTTNAGNHDVMDFDGGSQDEHAEFDVVMPARWDGGTLKAKVYWTNGSGASASDYVEFYLAAVAVADDDALDVALGTAVSIADQVIADGDVHVTAATAALTVAGSPAAGDLVHFRLSRDYDHNGGGTAMAEDARVLGVLIQYHADAAVAAW